MTNVVAELCIKNGRVTIFMFFCHAVVARVSDDGVELQPGWMS